MAKFSCHWLTGSGCLAISCYQCGSLDGDALPCDIFTKAPMWRQFQVECPPDHLCAKSITTHYDNDNGDGTTSQTSTSQSSISPSMFVPLFVCMTVVEGCRSSPSVIIHLSFFFYIQTTNIIIMKMIHVIRWSSGMRTGRECVPGAQRHRLRTGWPTGPDGLVPLRHRLVQRLQSTALVVGLYRFFSMSIA